MSEVSPVADEADADPQKRLDEEISAFNAAATGHHDGRLLSIAVRGDSDDLRAGLYGWTWGGCGYTECGRTPGYPHGHDDIHLVKLLR